MFAPDWATKIEPITAMPSAVPTWRIMPAAPDAEPALCGGMSLSTTFVSWLVAKPIPIPCSSRPGRRFQNPVSGPKTAVYHQMPAASKHEAHRDHVLRVRSGGSARRRCRR